MVLQMVLYGTVLCLMVLHGIVSHLIVLHMVLCGRAPHLMVLQMVLRRTALCLMVLHGKAPRLMVLCGMIVHDKEICYSGCGQLKTPETRVRIWGLCVQCHPTALYGHG